MKKDKAKTRKWSEMSNPEKVITVILLLAISGIAVKCTRSCTSQSSPEEAQRRELEFQKEVKNGGLDNGVWQVEEYLKNNLNDADSYEAVKWFTVADWGQSKKKYRYSVVHQYRAKNAFGAKVLTSQIFYLDSLGRVVSYEEWK